MPAPKTTPVQAADVFRPVFLRGLAALAYALMSIFWIGADDKVVTYSTAAFLVVTGVFMWQYVAVESAPEKSRAPYALGAGLMLFAGIAIIFVTSIAWVGYVGALAFLAGGIAELIVFAKYREAFPPFRNQLVSGAVGVILAISLCFSGGMDAHSLFGLIGGGTIILAVFALIAAFGHRHEMKAAAPTTTNTPGQENN
ncbi:MULTISPECIES: DUF308 domain-containing protein [Glutamicibacter]|uniref:DUF308 domain-containing protein n=2 Tax=Glutamicibacter arilaitensis TaxID=256701 RepID=A0A2N7RXM9_9MICC|nr:MULTISPECIES: DUF308 domain-containing protein [Glutamicibacter]PMQ18644.1 hypothetical protein CIK84_17745 [Glutamicibacter arilaitensis]CBT77308.1 hypothetical membrane protein [Glutamicibacter arilaitensis Re117]